MKLLTACKHLGSFLALTLLSACAGGGGSGEDSLVEVENEETIVPSWEEYFSWSQKGPQGTSFVAEGDLFFATKADLRAHYDQNVEATKLKLAVFQQISTGYEPVFVGGEAVDIVYCVANSFAKKSVAIADMAAATKDWQKVINVRFRYDSSQDSSCVETNANVDFAFIPLTDPINGILGCATNKMSWLPPVDGCPVGGVVPAAGFSAATLVKGGLYVNYGVYPFTGSFAYVTIVGVLRHELGHMLGFRHEHPWAPAQGGCKEPPTISLSDTTGRRLTPYDQKSVMQYPQCGGLTKVDQTISIQDGIGARTIYGMPASWYVPSVLYPTL